MDVKPWTVDVTEAVNLMTTAGNVLSYKALMRDESGKWVEPPESQSGYFIVSSNLVYYYDIIIYNVDDYSFLPHVLGFLFNALLAFWLTIVCCCCVAGAIAVKLILICVYGVMERKGGHELRGGGQMSGMSVVEMVQQPVVVNNHHRLLPTDDLDSVVSPVHVSKEILQH